MHSNGENKQASLYSVQIFSVDGSFKSEESHLPVEEDITLFVNGKEWLTFFCTPQHLEEMAVGFLFNENVIQSSDEISSIRVCEKYLVDLWLTHKAQRPEHWARTSGCNGGKTSHADANRQVRLVTDSRIEPGVVFLCINLLYEAQMNHQNGPGMHCSILSDGKLVLYTAVDIGRHNTIDKLAGMQLPEKNMHTDLILVTTGRISSEMINKAARMNVPFIISLTSPTNRAILHAEKAGITLIGYARRNHFNVYTHSDRMWQAKKIAGQA